MVPVGWSLGLSFFEGNSLRGFDWVGLQNFTTFFTDPAAFGTKVAHWTFLALFAALLTVEWLIRKAAGLI